MAKVLKFKLSYSSPNQEITEVILLPAEVNGVLFEYMEDSEVFIEKVFMGEIEGEYSQPHGDIIVKHIDMSELSIGERVNLINESNYSSLTLSFFEDMEHRHGVKKSSSKEKDELFAKYSLKLGDWIYTYSGVIHEAFIADLKSKYVEHVMNIHIHESDYKRIETLLKENGIDFY